MPLNIEYNKGLYTGYRMSKPYQVDSSFLPPAQGFQYISSLPVLHYLLHVQAVLFIKI